MKICLPMKAKFNQQLSLWAQEIGMQARFFELASRRKKAVNDLDVYGNRSVHVIPPQDPAQWAFDISQRVGNVSKFDYSNSFKPLFSMSPYSRTKEVYQPPSNLSSRPVYSISEYPRIKIASGIP